MSRQSRQAPFCCAGIRHSEGVECCGEMSAAALGGGPLGAAALRGRAAIDEALGAAALVAGCSGERHSVGDDFILGPSAARPFRCASRDDYSAVTSSPCAGEERESSVGTSSACAQLFLFVVSEGSTPNTVYVVPNDITSFFFSSVSYALGFMRRRPLFCCFISTVGAALIH